jgi:hypothetical protein
MSGPSLNPAAVHFVEQRVEPAVVGMRAGDDPGNTHFTIEFSSRVVLPK